MAAYPNTGSTLAFPSGANKTSTGLSTNIIIKVGNSAIGAIQSLTINESRSIQQIDEVGTDGHIDSAPHQSTKINGGCQRIRFDRMRISEAFGRGFVHAKSQRYPFDIEIIDTWNGDGDSSIITTIKNVWINKISYGFKASDYILTDDMDWEAEDIYSTLAGGPSAQGGERGLPLAVDAIEQEADVGLRRGGLDSAGLIKFYLPF